MDAHIQCDFLVAGSGYAGICAATQAARLGLTTVLVEKRLLLGGNGGPSVGVGATGALTTNRYWHETGIVEELELRVGHARARTCPTSFGYSIDPQWDAVATRMLTEAGVTVLRGQLLMGAQAQGGNITSATVLNMETLQRTTVEARYYLDDTGDAVLARLAGADVWLGREGRDQTGERSAPATADRFLSAASLTALVADTGVAQPFLPPEGTPPWNPDKPCNHFDPSRKIHFLWQVDEGGESAQNSSYDTPQALYGRLRSRIYSVWDYLKNRKYPEELATFALLWISPELGKREGPRIAGDYLLTQTDIEGGVPFADAAGFGGHYLDEHLPSFDGGYEVRFYNRPLPYDIPLRCLYSRNIENLFSAGRSVGVSHQAFTSVRLMRTGGQLGQAAAVCAALCLRNGVTPREVALHRAEQFRGELARNDGWTIGFRERSTVEAYPGIRAAASSEAALTENEADVQYLPAEQGFAVWLTDYPETITQVRLRVRNPAAAAMALTLELAYGETPPILLKPVPEAVYDPQRRAYRESEDARLAGAAEAGAATPQGKAGFCHYFVRDDTLHVTEPLCTAEAQVPAGFDGTLSVPVRLPHALPAWNRRIGGQGLRLRVQGAALVAVTPQPLDILQGQGLRPVFGLAPTHAYGAAANVLDGVIHREGGAKLHAWRSAPGAPMPQWLELAWDRPRPVQEIRLHFDDTEAVFWEMSYLVGDRASRLLVADYQLQLRVEGHWRTVAEGRDNYLRFVCHSLAEPVQADAFRLTVYRVWGEGCPASVYHVGLAPRKA